MNRHRAGTTVRLSATFRDPVTGSLTDPDGGVTVTVWDPRGAMNVDAGTMTKQSTGVYYFNMQTATGWERGIYSVLTDGFHGTYHTLVEADLFKLWGR
jgi:hypothetical protein